jgi:Domain of unknown function (DUF1707)
MRVSDAERQVVQAELHRAHDEGRLTLAEFDTRVAGVWKAATRGELTRFTADLPKAAPSKAVVKGGSGMSLWMRILVTVWLSVSVLNLAIWGMVSLTTDQPVHPWFLWVFVPLGVVIGGLWFSGLGRKRR